MEAKAEGEAMDWKHLLAYITGTVDQELLLRNEYLVTENRILRNQITGRMRLTDGERQTLAEIGHKLGKQALEEVATIVKPDTSLAWHRTLVAQKFDGSQQRQSPGRPKIDQELEALIVRIARANRSWGYDRIAGALANLGVTVSDQTVGNVLKRHGIAPAPERKITTTWKEFIRIHMDVLVATDFFTTEVWTLGGLVTYYVLFFIHLSSRQVHVAGVTRVPLPLRPPNLNAYAERWVRSVKEECLSQMILFGEASLRHALTQHVEHFHHERNHQGQGNVLIFPTVSPDTARQGPIRCHERL
jgi:hypothetical protein